MRAISGNSREHGMLDETDKRVLELMQRNSRATFQEIGATVGLSAPAVKRRVDRLVAIGAIHGFTTTINPEWLGRRAEAFVELYCTGGTAPKELLATLSRFPEVIFAATVTGDADALVHVAAEDITHLEETLEAIRAAASVERTRSSVILSRLIDQGRPVLKSTLPERKAR